MKIIRFKANGRSFWLLFFVMYAVAWFLPVLNGKSGVLAPITLLWMLWTEGVPSGLTAPATAAAASLAFACIISIPTMVTAWLIQFLIDVSRARRK